MAKMSVSEKFNCGKYTR